MQEDTDSDEIYEEDTDSVSPARPAHRPAVKEAEDNGNATDADLSRPLTVSTETCKV